MSRVQEAPSNAPIAVIRSLSARKTRDVMGCALLKPESCFASSSREGKWSILLDGGDDVVVWMVIAVLDSIGEQNPAGCLGMGIIAALLLLSLLLRGGGVRWTAAASSDGTKNSKSEHMTKLIRSCMTQIWLAAGVACMHEDWHGDMVG